MALFSYQGGALKLSQKLNNIMTSFATYPGLVTFQNDALPQWMRAGILLVDLFRIYPTLLATNLVIGGGCLSFIC